MFKQVKPLERKEEKFAPVRKSRIEPAGTVVCPACKSELKLEKDTRGILKTNDLNTMRVKTPIYINPQKTAEVSLDLSVCSQCNTIIGITRKAM
ncbi:MAG: hypothetical protein ACXABG_10070 [Promethearchaeota archaeon]|jgi:hypothetical protein